MKIFIVLALMGFSVYWISAENDSFVKASILDRFYGDKAEDSKYLEGRLNMSEDGISLDVVMLVRLRAWDDCGEISKKIIDSKIGKCPGCTFEIKECTGKLSKRYAKLFDNKPAQTSYLSYDAADATERDMRMLTWGLNREQARMACSMLVNSTGQRTKNQPLCIASTGL
jgi:hypothetical protein